VIKKSLVGAMLCAIVISLAVAAGSTKASDEAKPALPVDVLDVTWQWVNFVTPKEQIDVSDPSLYTIELTAHGGVALQIDCNRGISNYKLDVDNRISFSPIGMTMMMCDDDQLGNRFAAELERVGTWFQKDGDFFLELPFSSGTFRFRQAP
jgi:heat shock protein HslJ